MKAPIEQQRALLDLQTVDSRLSRIDALLAELPEDKSAAEIEREASVARRVLADVEAERDDAALELRRIEQDADVVRGRIVRDRERRDSSSSAKDIQGLESELASLQKRLNDLDDMQLAVMERAELIAERVDTAQREYERVREAQEQAQAAAAARRSELTAERVILAEDRARIAQPINPDLLALYDRQRARYGVGAALLRGGVSGATGVALDESDLAAIRTAAPDEVVFDPDGCILVRTEESGL